MAGETLHSTPNPASACCLPAGDRSVQATLELRMMRPLVYSDTGAELAFYVVVGVFVVLEQATRVRSVLNRDGDRRDQGSFYVLVVFIGVGLAGAFVIASLAPGAAVTGTWRWVTFIAGMVLMVAGIVLRQWSVALLGRSFTVDVRVQAGQTVVDTGPYRWVRHPSYTGMLITFAGIGLALGNGLSLVCAVLVPCIGLVRRIRVEERALLDGLGDPYRRYATGRARLIPKLW
jgi:protein-S-isoprenylcysteine O-methyltransferase Ste14